MLTTKVSGSVSTSIQVPARVLHLQPARDVLAVEDGEETVVGVLPAAQLAGLRRLIHLRIEVEPHGGDVPVDLVVEEVLLEAEAQRGEAHELADQALHRRVVARGGLAEARRVARPDIGDEIALAFGAGEIGLVGPALAAEVVVLLEVGRRHVGVAVAQRLVADRLVAARGLDVRGHDLELLLHRQGEEGVCLAVEAADDLGRHAMAGDGEEADLGAGAIDLPARAQARGGIAGERAAEIDDGDLGLHRIPFRAFRAFVLAQW